MKKPHKSTNPPAGRLDSSLLLEVMSRVFWGSIDSVSDSKEARKALVNALDGMRSREIISIILRASGLTYRACGEVMGCTSERVRQNEAKGFRKLRNPKLVASMREHIKNP